jgi:hypothetical protein
VSLALEELSERIRALTPDLLLIEKKMFNGRAFMYRGNMMVCPIKDGTLLVRVGKEGMSNALARPGAAPMVMNGRTMGGFVFVSGDAIEDDDALAGWLGTARTLVETLPPK